MPQKNFSKIINFIKYNNTFILIVFLVFAFGFGAFASETGREVVGQKTEIMEGEDNTLLLEADLDNFDMNFEVEKIEKDDEFYYITYTYFDLDKKQNAWQFGLKENVRRFSIKRSSDLAGLLAEELREEREKRISDLKKEQQKARKEGPKKREQVEKYTGLLGKVFAGVDKIVPAFEAEKRKEIGSPISPGQIRQKNREIRQNQGSAGADSVSPSDDLTEVYNDYIAEKDPDGDNVFGENDNCPTVHNTGQLDSDGDGIGDVCDLNPIKGDLDGVPDEENDEENSQNEGEVELENNSDETSGENEDKKTEEIETAEESEADNSEQESEENQASENEPSSSESTDAGADNSEKEAEPEDNTSQNNLENNKNDTTPVEVIEDSENDNSVEVVE